MLRCNVSDDQKNYGNSQIIHHFVLFRCVAPKVTNRLLGTLQKSQSRAVVELKLQNILQIHLTVAVITCHNNMS